MSLYLEDVYFNGLIQGRSLLARKPVLAATTGNITLYGPQVIDGVSLNAGDRVLVKDQLVAGNNGIYDVQTTAWTRAQDFDYGNVSGLSVHVIKGDTNASQTFYCNNTIGNDIIGTHDLVFDFVVVGTKAQTLKNKSLVDSSTYLVSETDPSKKARFDVSKISGNTAKTLYLPDASGELLTTNAAQTLTNKTLVDDMLISNVTDETKKVKLDLSNITTSTTRTLTVPDFDGTLVTTSGAQTLTNKTLVAPIVDKILDSTYNSEVLRISANAAANTYISLSNETIEVAGSAADTSLTLKAKGTGTINFVGSGSNDAATRYYNTGGNYVELKAPSTIDSSYSLKLPNSYPTGSKYVMKSLGSDGSLVFSLDRVTFTLANTINIVTNTPTVLATTGFPWINSFYGTSGDMRLEDGYCTYLYTATSPAFNRVLKVEMINTTDDAILGTSNVTLTTSAPTAVRFQFTLPTVDCRLQMRISATGTGGNITVSGGSLDFGKW
jgi:hypothetical protein